MSLYEKLGGEAGVERIVDNFINEIGADEVVFEFFRHSDVGRFRTKITEHLCFISDGPCDYTGDSMIDVHANMAVTEAAFNRTVDLLVNAMNGAGVTHVDQNQLLARLAPLRKDIIYIRR